MTPSSKSLHSPDNEQIPSNIKKEFVQVVLLYLVWRLLEKPKENRRLAIKNDDLEKDLWYQRFGDPEVSALAVESVVGTPPGEAAEVLAGRYL